jgi:hypothetical protein
MRNGWQLLAAAVLVLGGCSKAASDKTSTPADTKAYTLKVKLFPDAGKTVEVTDSEKTTGSVKVSAGNKAKEEKQDEVKEETYTETVLEKGDPHPKKVQRTYKKASSTKGGKDVTRPYQGRTVMFELEDGKYTAKAEGQPPLSKRDLDGLAEKVYDPAKPDLDEILLPKGAVKVNESWTLDYKQLAKSFAKTGELDIDKTKAEAKLAKVYEKAGKQHGVIEFDLNMAIKDLKGLKFDPPALLRFKGTMDSAIDGSSTAAVAEMAGTFTGKTSSPDGKVTIGLDLAVTMKKERSAEK